MQQLRIHVILKRTFFFSVPTKLHFYFQSRVAQGEKMHSINDAQTTPKA
jgi:hypothetical protein